jgi:hypothetical protein
LSNADHEQPLSKQEIAECERKLLDLIADLDSFTQQNKAFSGLNIFEAAGLHRQEIRHSNFLAFLLRPQENHGLGDGVLKRLMKKALDNLPANPPVSSLTFALADFNDALVSREWRDIDLVVESKNNQFVFAIENKIDASESEHQLSKYEGIIRSSFPNQRTLFAYLTNEGDPPSNDLWSAISYSDVIGALQEARFHHSVNLTSEATMVIDQYISMVRRNIVQIRTS